MLKSSWVSAVLLPEAIPVYRRRIQLSEGPSATHGLGCLDSSHAIVGTPRSPMLRFCSRYARLHQKAVMSVCPKDNCLQGGQ